MTDSFRLSKPLWQRPLMIAPFLLWGSAMVVMRDALPETTPMFIGIMRLLPAGLAVLAFRYAVGRQSTQTPWNPLTWKAWAWIGLFALVDGSFFQGFLAAGLMDTGAGLGSVMIDSQPLAVALMAAWFYQERMGLLGWLSLVVGVLGISIIGLSPMWGSESLALSVGQGWMLLAALSMAVGTVLMRPISRHVDPVIATGWHMILGSLPLIVISALTETHQWDHLSVNHWIGLGYTSLLGSALAYGLFFYFASEENLTEFSSLTFLTPVFALVFASLFLSESLTVAQWGGVGVTLISVYLMNKRGDIETWIRQAVTSVGTTDPNLEADCTVER